MSGSPDSEPNAGQIEYWNEVSGHKWVSAQPLLDAQISPLGLAAMDRAKVARGERVLDVGCGCGQTTLQLAERVGAKGSVTGIDLSGPMLTRARERAREARAGQVSFEQADAQLHRFAADGIDLVFSRFGVMFFADPTAAFANLASGLAAGGRIAFVCWQGLDANEWLRVPLMAAAKHVDMPPPPAPGTPGPLSFADPERVRGILEGAGFRNLGIEPITGELSIGGGADLDLATEFVLNLGPTARVLAEVDAATRARAAEEVRRAIAPHASDDGVRMRYGAWVVTAGI